MLETRQGLKTKWSNFFAAILDPATIILILTTGLLLYQTNTQTDKTLITILTLLNSLSSGLLGGILAKNWLEQSETTVIITRGRTAIRNLKLLLNSVVAAENRVLSFLLRVKSAQPSKELVETYLEEIITKYKDLEEEVINSIENWTDIIPEAAVKTQIGIITELTHTIDTKESQKEQLEKQLAENTQASSEQVITLKKQIERKETELQRARDELTQKRITLESTGVNIGVNIPSVIANRMTLDSRGRILYSDIKLSTPIHCKRCSILNLDLPEDGICELCRAKENEE